MITEVIKGADDEIEFKGFKGRHFFNLAKAWGAILFFVFFMYAIGFTSFFLIAILLGGWGMSYMYIQNQMETLGKNGHIHRQHKSPEQLTLNKPFYQLWDNKQKK